MRIIHYALGFPPSRTGGLTKYCIDLMLTQKAEGHEVSLIWPGRFALRSSELKISKRKEWKGINSFEIVNPLPVSLDEGIKDCGLYIMPVKTEKIAQFLKKEKPDIFHIHTLMGLPKEFIDVTNQLGIRTVFTSHDYYGICPKVTLFNKGGQCLHSLDCSDCPSCNKNALSLNKIKLIQSPIYRYFKNSPIVRLIRKKHRNSFFYQDSAVNNNPIKDTKEIEHYIELRNYYISMLENINIIHFNSTISESVYLNFINPKNYKVVPITHRDISDHRNTKIKMSLAKQA